ncbi:response regulator [Methylovulum psychrotolerans]|uniref:Response regulator n=1 Tax=Methylovulum psychrotolerans TaxID=1704499 RepID=A0A1Z4C5D0_9GAMM|nr:response regulator [Methylovulum psychrotolerans]ASF48763.1 response regulator [Methylovulum psychrotolerans]POZ51408.1 response regulator [Methylovulum psychrotolerans]
MISTAEILNSSILIVDDQLSNVLLLEQMLEGAGYTCIASTTDPTKVCGLYQKNRYDLILLDLQMPGMDGFQVMEGLKRIETDGYLPILVITAQPNHKLRALTVGAKDFVSKPFDLIEVQNRIRNMLEVRLLYKNLEYYNQSLEQIVAERTIELSASEERFRRLTELSSDWYWEQDANGQFTMVYGPVHEMLGIRINNDVLDNVEEQGIIWDEAERLVLETNLAARKPFLDFVYSRNKPNGQRQYLMVSGEPVFDPSGRFIGYRGIGKDVTETMRPGNITP